MIGRKNKGKIALSSTIKHNTKDEKKREKFLINTQSAASTCNKKLDNGSNAVMAAIQQLK